MQGRYGSYGTDRLTRFLIVLFLIVFVITSFTTTPHDRFVPLLIVCFLYYRMLSRNIPARYRENDRFVQIEDRLLHRFSALKTGIRERSRFHIWRCPGCGQKIRIPRGKGRIMVRCPKCANEFLKVS